MVSSSESKRSRRKLSDEESRLWTGYTHSVAPLRAGSTQTAELQQPKPERLSRGAEIPRTARATSVAPVTPIIRRDKQRLARGKVPIASRLDLHGKTQTEAHAALLGFLRRAQADGEKFALVITGKGDRSLSQSTKTGVLRRQVPLWLGLPQFRTYVNAFGEADAAHGGAGALYVQLRRLRGSHSKE
jgi:DNA-nicking Smr family endonuclease